MGTHITLKQLYKRCVSSFINFQIVDIEKKSFALSCYMIETKYIHTLITTSGDWEMKQCIFKSNRTLQFRSNC